MHGDHDNLEERIEEHGGGEFLEVVDDDCDDECDDEYDDYNGDDDDE